MKKRSVLLCGLLCALLLSACGGKSALEGRYLRAAGGASLIVTEANGPIVLSDLSEAGGLFDGLNSGDRIAVTCDGVAETYPGQAGAFSCKLLEDGTPDDIPSGTLNELAGLGYAPVGGSTADGWYLETVEGSGEGGPLLVGDGWPKGECLVDMVSGLFDGLESGDRIRITYDCPDSSPWPGVNWVFTCELLEKGSLDDVPEEALTALEAAGYDFGRHIHRPAEEPQTAEDPVSGYCGNTVTKVTVDGEAYSFWGGDSVTLTDILINLAYDPVEVCRCMTEFTVDTEFATGYGVNLTESFARCEAGQAGLTAEQTETIRDILARNCGGVTVTEAAGKAELQTFLCIGDTAADLTELLEGLSYAGGICKCLPEYTVETSGGVCYGVNLTERYVQLENCQAALTEAQAALLQELFDRSGGI